MSVLDDRSSMVNRGTVAANLKAEQLRLTSQLNELQKRRESLAAQLGASLYEEARKDPKLREGREELLQEMEQLDLQRVEYAERLQELEVEAATTRASARVVMCPVCHAPMRANDMFCSVCGAPAPTASPVAPAAAAHLAPAAPAPVAPPSAAPMAPTPTAPAASAPVTSVPRFASSASPAPAPARAARPAPAPSASVPSASAPVPPRSPAPPPVPAANATVCAVCGAPVSKNDAFCLRCGAPIAAESPKVRPTVAPTPVASANAAVAFPTEAVRANAASGSNRRRSGGSEISPKTVCPQCGRPLNEGEEICANCGYQLIAGDSKATFLEETTVLEISNPQEAQELGFEIIEIGDLAVTAESEDDLTANTTEEDFLLEDAPSPSPSDAVDGIDVIVETGEADAEPSEGNDAREEEGFEESRDESELVDENGDVEDEASDQQAEARNRAEREVETALDIELSYELNRELADDLSKEEIAEVKNAIEENLSLDDVVDSEEADVQVSAAEEAMDDAIDAAAEEALNQAAGNVAASVEDDALRASFENTLQDALEEAAAQEAAEKAGTEAVKKQLKEEKPPKEHKQDPVLNPSFNKPTSAKEPKKPAVAEPEPAVVRTPTPYEQPEQPKAVSQKRSAITSNQPFISSVPAQAGETTQFLSAQDGRTCPQCGQPVLPEDRFCMGCGAPLAPTVSQTPAAENVCPVCGAPVEEEFVFCGNCGHRLA